MGQVEYNKIKEVALKQQKIEKQILELEKNLEVAILLDEPLEVFTIIRNSIERLKRKQHLVFGQLC